MDNGELKKVRKDVSWGIFSKYTLFSGALTRAIDRPEKESLRAAPEVRTMLRTISTEIYRTYNPGTFIP